MFSFLTIFGATVVQYDFNNNWATNGLVPCDGVVKECDFNAFLQLVANLISFMFYFSILVTVFLLVQAAYIYITKGDNPSAAKEVRKKLKTVAYGFLLMLSAWLIVNALVSAIMDTNVISNPLVN